MPSGASKFCSESASDPECYGAIYAWHHNGDQVRGFPMWPKDSMDKNSFVRSSPTVADVDNDGQLEILFSMLWSVIVVGRNGEQEEDLRTTYSVYASPAIGDTNGNGKMEVWIGGSHYDDQSKGYLWRFESDTAGVGGMPWPMFHRDAQNTGYYPMPPRLEIPSAKLYLMHQYGSGDTERDQINISNPGDTAFNWQVTSCPNGVTPEPSSGTVPPVSEDQMTITISTTGYTTGTHDLGDIVIAATADGDPVDGSPFEIPITLYVGDVHSVYLPLTIRSIP